jgi:hypothetical protein
MPGFRGEDWSTLKTFHFGLMTIAEHELKKFPPIQEEFVEWAS